jgi:hypothetical protein
MSDTGQTTPNDYTKLRTENLDLHITPGSPNFKNGFIAAFVWEDGEGISITAYRAFFFVRGKLITSIVSGNKELVYVAVRELVKGLA